MVEVNKKNLFLLGANKCGTNFLYELFRQSDQILCPTIKEPHFFSSFECDLPVGGYYPIHVISDFSRYKNLYKQSSRFKYKLDASTSYLYNHKNVLENFQKFDIHPTNTKMIVVIRDPVKRIWSHFMANVKDDAERLSFLEATSKAVIDERLISGWWGGYDYIRCGLYVDNIREFVGAGYEVKVVSFEDLIGDCDEVFKSLLDFLEMPYFAFKKHGNFRNQSGIPKYQIINTMGLLVRRNKALRFLNYRLRELGFNFHRNVFKRAVSSNLQRVECPEEYKKVFYRLYEEEILKIYSEFGIDYMRKSI